LSGVRAIGALAKETDANALTLEHVLEILNTKGVDL
jgi:hypothetical protein